MCDVSERERERERDEYWKWKKSEGGDMKRWAPGHNTTDSSY
jgi:hypothetical protein